MRLFAEANQYTRDTRIDFLKAIDHYKPDWSKAIDDFILEEAKNGFSSYSVKILDLPNIIDLSKNQTLITANSNFVFQRMLAEKIYDHYKSLGFVVDIIYNEEVLIKWI